MARWRRRGDRRDRALLAWRERCAPRPSERGEQAVVEVRGPSPVGAPDARTLGGSCCPIEVGALPRRVAGIHAGEVEEPLGDFRPDASVTPQQPGRRVDLDRYPKRVT